MVSDRSIVLYHSQTDWSRESPHPLASAPARALYITHKWGACGGLRPPQKNLFSVCFGGKAAKTNRKQYDIGGAAPRRNSQGGGTPYAVSHPDTVQLWVMISPEGEGGRGVRAYRLPESERAGQPDCNVSTNYVLDKKLCLIAIHSMPIFW